MNTRFAQVFLARKVNIFTTIKAESAADLFKIYNLKSDSDGENLSSLGNICPRTTPHNVVVKHASGGEGSLSIKLAPSINLTTSYAIYEAS